MSYSFSVTAPTKDAAILAVAAKFAEMATSQPIHARDFHAAISNVTAVVDLLDEDGSLHVQVSCNGYVGWNGVLRDDARNPLRSASVSAAASLIEPPQKDTD